MSDNPKPRSLWRETAPSRRYRLLLLRNPEWVSRAVQESIKQASRKQVEEYLACEGTGPIDSELWDAFVSRSGDDQIMDWCQERLDWLNQDDAARELCFQRAAELRARGKA